MKISKTYMSKVPKDIRVFSGIEYRGLKCDFYDSVTDNGRTTYYGFLLDRGSERHLIPIATITKEGDRYNSYTNMLSARCSAMEKFHTYKFLRAVSSVLAYNRKFGLRYTIINKGGTNG